MNRIQLYVVRLLFVCGCLAPSQLSRAGDAEVRQRLKEDLAVLHVWLGDGENGQAWRRYLRSDGLQALLVQPQEAERAAVAEVLAAYQSDAPGLERPQFVRVRNRLAAWLKTLTPALSLAEAALQAKGHYQPVSAGEVQQRRAALEQAMKELTLFLQATSAERLANWRAYLQWDTLTKELAADEGPNIEALRNVVAQLRSGEAGLELPQFDNLRTQLTSYINGVYYTTDGNVEKTYGLLLDRLSALFKTYKEDPSTETGATISQYVKWLLDGGLAPAFVAQTQQQNSQPNLYIAVAHDLISAGIKEEVDEYTEVRDSILGSRVRGGGNTRGRVSIELLPNNKYADLLIKLHAKNHAKTRAYRKPVVVFNRSQTSIYAASRVGVNADGLHAAGGAVASCNTHSQITGIAAKRKIVQKIANKKAHQLKGQASYIAARHAETRASKKMNKRIAEMLVEANKSFEERFRLPLVRRFAFPKQLQFSTTMEHLHIFALQSDAHQLAASTPPPSPPAALAMRIHESMVRNSSEMILGGRQLTKDKLADLFEEFDRELPPELANAPAEDGEEPVEDDWTIDFSSQNPLSQRQSPFAATFEGNRILLTAWARKFSGRGTETKYPTKITAAYDIAPGQPPKLVRDGEVQVEFLTREKLGPLDFATRAKLKRRFEPIFKPEIIFGDIKLPERMAAAGPLRLTSVTSDNGWLTLGWDLGRSDTSVQHVAPSSKALLRAVGRGRLLGGLTKHGAE